MKTDEIKLRVVKFAEETIDLYVPANGFFDKLKKFNNETVGSPEFMETQQNIGCFQ